MVDIVVNHMAWVGTPTNVDYSQLIPFDNASYYHPYCPLSDNAIVVSIFQEFISCN
jgi:alpha-amylase